MRSRNSGLGFIEIDHRNSPGVSPRDAARFGCLPVGPGERLEADCASCSHCQVIVILNPERERERAICRACDRYVCDGCAPAAAAGFCVTFAERLDVVAEAIIRNRPPGV